MQTVGAIVFFRICQNWHQLLVLLNVSCQCQVTQVKYKVIPVKYKVTPCVTPLYICCCKVQ